METTSWNIIWTRAYTSTYATPIKDRTIKVQDDDDACDEVVANTDAMSYSGRIACSAGTKELGTYIDFRPVRLLR